MRQVESYRQIAIGDRLVGDSLRQERCSARARDGERREIRMAEEEVEMKRLSTILQVIRISGIV